MNRTQSGFTLLELMMTMAILVLIISMAMPSMTGFVQRNRLSAEVRGIVGAVALARSEAITRRTIVAVVPLVVADGWNSGWRVIELNSAGGEEGTAFRQSDPFPTGYTMVLNPVQTSLPFLPRGLLNLTAGVDIVLADGKGNSSTVKMPLSGSAYIR
jgi:type IV fimbrial biogenesis protein FimT